MSQTPKTIQIILPSGVAEITTRIVQAIEVPRRLLTEVAKMPRIERA